MSLIRKDVLNGWKEIAAYLGRDSRTVERWEKNRSLPVRRLPGSGRATVYALVPELDAWLAGPAPKAEASEAALPGTERVPESAAYAALASFGIDKGPEAIIVPEPGPPERVFIPVLKRRRRKLGLVAVMLVLLLVGAVGARIRSREKSRTRPVIRRERTLVPPSRVAGVEELYLRGCYQTELRSPESIRHAQAVFSQAIAKDPSYAPAFAGLAKTYILAREYSTVPDAMAYGQARDAATKAISLDPTLPQAHAVLGFIDFFWNWDSASANAQFQTALQLDPNLTLAHHWYGSVLTHQGRYKEGLRELDLAQRLDPSSSAILTVRALALGLSGRRAESSDLLNEAISSERKGAHQNPATMHLVMGLLSLMAPRDVHRFLSETMLAAELREDTLVVAAMRHATEIYDAKGERAMWQALLTEEQELHQRSGPTYAMARYEAELGAEDQSINHLADLLARHDPALIGISVDPLFTSLRQDPRFQRLRTAMGLPNSDLD